MNNLLKKIKIKNKGVFRQSRTRSETARARAGRRGRSGVVGGQRGESSPQRCNFKVFLMCLVSYMHVFECFNVVCCNLNIYAFIIIVLTIKKKKKLYLVTNRANISTNSSSTTSFRHRRTNVGRRWRSGLLSSMKIEILMLSLMF